MIRRFLRFLCFSSSVHPQYQPATDSVSHAQTENRLTFHSQNNKIFIAPPDGETESMNTQMPWTVGVAGDETIRTINLFTTERRRNSLNDEEEENEELVEQRVITSVTETAPAESASTEEEADEEASEAADEPVRSVMSEMQVEPMTSLSIQTETAMTSSSIHTETAMTVEPLSSPIQTFSEMTVEPLSSSIETFSGSSSIQTFDSQVASSISSRVPQINLPEQHDANFSPPPIFSREPTFAWERTISPESSSASMHFDSSASVSPESDQLTPLSQSPSYRLHVQSPRPLALLNYRRRSHLNRNAMLHDSRESVLRMMKSDGMSLAEVIQALKGLLAEELKDFRSRLDRNGRDSLVFYRLMAKLVYDPQRDAFWRTVKFPIGLEEMQMVLFDCEMDLETRQRLLQLCFEYVLFGRSVRSDGLRRLKKRAVAFAQTRRSEPKLIRLALGLAGESLEKAMSTTDLKNEKMK